MQIQDHTSISRAIVKRQIPLGAKLKTIYFFHNRKQVSHSKKKKQVYETGNFL